MALTLSKAVETVAIATVQENRESLLNGEIISFGGRHKNWYVVFDRNEEGFEREDIRWLWKVNVGNDGFLVGMIKKEKHS